MITCHGQLIVANSSRRVGGGKLSHSAGIGEFSLVMVVGYWILIFLFYIAVILPLGYNLLQMTHKMDGHINGSNN